MSAMTVRNGDKTSLDYSFRYQKSQITTREKTKIKTEEYVYDLENTWKLNMEMYENMLVEFSGFSKENLNAICIKIKNIKMLFEKKKSLRFGKSALRGKILMDKQILEEHIRQKEETYIEYNELIAENSDNLKKKAIFCNQFEKKFDEVEIFVQREAKSDVKLWECFLSYEIIAFVNNNEMIQTRRIGILEELDLINFKKSTIFKENAVLKIRDNKKTKNKFYDNDKNSQFIDLFKINKFKEREIEYLKIVFNGMLKNTFLQSLVSTNENYDTNNYNTQIGRLVYDDPYLSDDDINNSDRRNSKKIDKKLSNYRLHDKENWDISCIQNTD